MPIVNLSDDQKRIIREAKAKYQFVSDIKLGQILANEQGGNPETWERRCNVFKETPISDIDLTKQSDYSLPETFYEAFEPYYLPDAYRRILVLHDIHIPYQDNNALRLAIDYGKEHDADCIILNGDIIDCYAESFWQTKPHLRRFKLELDITKKFLTILREQFPTAHIVFKFGNHEERHERFLIDRAPIWYEMEETKLENLLQLNLNRIECVKDKRIIRAGKLHILHGHEIRIGGNINLARTMRIYTGVNTLFGHWHITQTDYQCKIDNSTFGAWAAGCLCGKNPDYARLNNWKHGFAFVLRDGNDFEVDNKLIINGKVR